MEPFEGGLVTLAGVGLIELGFRRYLVQPALVDAIERSGRSGVAGGRCEVGSGCFAPKLALRARVRTVVVLHRQCACIAV